MIIVFSLLQSKTICNFGVKQNYGLILLFLYYSAGEHLGTIKLLSAFSTIVLREREREKRERERERLRERERERERERNMSYV